MKYDIFISYSRKDIEFARKVCAVLDSYKQYYDFEYFFDQSEITSRDEYLKRISSAILESRVVLFLASKNSYDSEFCAKELLFADKKGRHIHQYLLDEAEMPSDIEMLLGTHQYRELKNTPIESVVKEVLSNSLSREILTLDELNENNKLERQKQRTIQQQEIREKISALENRCFEIKAEILSYEQKVAELEREKSSVERQIRDLHNLLVEDEIALSNAKSTTMSNVVLSKLNRENGGLGSVLSGLENTHIYKSLSGLVKDIMMTLESEPKSVDLKVYKVGDFYDDGTKKGVVFEVSEDGKHGKIVSLDEAKLPWCTEEQYRKDIQVGANSDRDGKTNTDVVMQRSDYAEYPAFRWCREQGEEWYLPSNEELLVLYRVIGLVNKTLTQNSYKEIRDYRHWSSTEKDEFCAWFVSMFNGNTFNGTKYRNGYVRAVSAF